MKRSKRRVLLWILLLLLTLVLVYALVRVFSTQRDYRLEAEAHQQLLPYRPVSDESQVPETAGPEAADTGVPGETGPAPDTETASGTETASLVVNESILRLKSDHPYALGWISIQGTAIDYPFVQGPDNDYFLRRDVDGNYLYAGVPFLDYRCDPELNGPNSVIYGHNLKNGTMFGDLEKFLNQQFFQSHRDLLVYLADRTIRAELVACLLIDPDRKQYVYAIQPEADHLERLLADAAVSLPTPSSPEQRFITLSTCGYSFQGARIVLVGIVTEP